MKHLHTILLAAGLLSSVAISEARQAAPQRPPTPSVPSSPLSATGPQQPAVQMVLPDARDSRETRERLRDVLEQYPPSVGEVLRIDPTLLSRPDYLATYPVLAAFLQQHPEVAHNPGYFIGETRVAEANENNPQMEAVRAVRSFVDGITNVLIVMTLSAGVVFLVRTVVEHRRWQRAMKAQTEVHTKLIDRFASSDELLAYLQSPQGKALTDAPALPQAAARAMDAPLGRIFWSLQAGSVLACAGAGLLFVGGGMRDDLALITPSISAFGTVVLAIGVGFLVSSAVSFLLSQRLGLVQPLSTPHAGEAPGS